MIRYDKSFAQIEAEVDDLAPTWRVRARERTERFRKSGGYEEKSSIWSEVKDVFMRLQRNKCAYCETKLEGGPLGGIQHDLEHFRPKRGVSAWPPASSSLHYPFPTGDAFPGGYYLLAYHLGNYATACKTCNTVLKSNYFPIAGDRISARNDPEDYAAEQPFLIYPLGNSDIDPEDIIAFEGVKAVPACQIEDNEEEWRRGRVTIDFFELNRDGLQEDRALTIIALWMTCERSGELFFKETQEILTSIGSAHTNCARCFVRLCETDMVAARKIAERAQETRRSVTK